MSTITISLTDEALRKLKEQASRINVTPEELARAGVEEVIVRPEATFQKIKERILKENAALYRRLA